MRVADEGTELDRLVQDVQASVKYRDVCADLIRRIGAQELYKRRKFKEAVKSTRNKLHQVAGAYLVTGGHEPYTGWLSALAQAAETGKVEELRQACQQIMSNHTSTRERLPILDTFYTTLLAELAPVHSVLDLACGLNPLAIPWLPLAPGARYYACDIYVRMMAFLHDAMQLMGVPGQAWAGDILQSTPQQEVDVAFLLKIIPCLEQVDKQAGYQLLRAVRARHLVVSFPLHSLGGHSKGMLSNYERHFRELLAAEPWSWRRYEFASELVFVVSKEQ
ncbi:16S rRNA methyltransferase [Ktedonosporobacter rubrisoli]|uniref:16S rRNA (guanine(1405)-N(7))-methyltransferase n=1 Tax=Ktedonosporobacter rubrisoli TaxID=2509675 RepID=A0A4P6JVK1_KTERU|nr:16S rRNA methyltransferase [Ktedonosporobacter rubrisoli]QBD79564.1 16S rRNA methyltransferase [Ktedonosporobacter rubrisoli]